MARKKTSSASRRTSSAASQRRRSGGSVSRPASLQARPGPSSPEPSVAAEPGSTGLTEEQLKKCKSGLTKKDIERYRRLLLQKRAEILGDVAAIQSDARSPNRSGNLSNMPLHMADIGTENYDQEFNLSLVESERRLLREIDAALMRIAKGYYGVCLETGKPIGKARLDVKPWARYCIEVAREKERRGERMV